MSTTLERVLQVSATQLDISISYIKPDSVYTTDLGADSLDLIGLEQAVENEFDVRFPETRRYKFLTPDDFVAAVEMHLAVKRGAERDQARDRTDHAARIEGRIQDLKALEHRHIDADSRTIQAALMLLEAKAPTVDLYGERLAEAGFLHNTAIDSLRLQLAKAQLREQARAASDAADLALSMALPTGSAIGNLYERAAAGAAARRRDDKGPPTLKLGEIQSRLGMRVTEVFLASLGYPPALAEQGARYYHEDQFAPICSAIASHALTTATRDFLAEAQAAAAKQAAEAVS
jgi:acyl carrier protein